tara:strand:- start:341 stop:1207 length:867 start_codon:yes stop_codon:yes gene_type:complete
MNKKRILITGGNSPVTIDILKKINFNKNNIIVSTRKSIKKKYKFNKVQYIKIDLKNKIKLKEKNFDYLIHVASATPYKRYSSSEYYKTNILGFKNLLNSTENIKKVVLFSTTDVLDLASKNGLTKLKKDKKLIYSKSKHQMEKILKIYAIKNKIRCLVLRCPAIMCKTPNDINFIQKIIHNFVKKKNITVYNPQIRFNNIIDTTTLSNLINYFLKNNNLNKYFYVFSLAPRDNVSLLNFFKLINKQKKLDINFNYANDKRKITKPIIVPKKIFSNFDMPYIKKIIKRI